MSKQISRRDFLKLAGVGAVTTAVLTGCGPASRYVNIDQRQLTVDQIFNPYKLRGEKVFGQNGEFRIQTIDPNSLKGKLSSNTLATEADKQLKQIQDEQNKTLDQIESVQILQKKTEKGWESVMLPGSFMSKLDIAAFGDYFAKYATNQDEKTKTQFFATVFNPNMQTADKMQAITQYLNVPDAGTAQNIIEHLDLVNKYNADIPDNAPWDFIFDAYVSAANIAITDNLYTVAEKTNTVFGMFVPKNSEMQKAKDEFGKMFIPIDKLTKPEIYMVDSQITIPSADSSTPPTVVTKHKMITYYGPGKEVKIGDSIPSQFDDGSPENQKKNESNINLLAESSLPADLRLQVVGMPTRVRRVKPENVDYGFIPQGMNKDKGVVEPVVFLTDTDGDFANSKVIVANDCSVMNRVDWGKKNWVTKVTNAIDKLQEGGATEAFKYGLLPTKHAYGRIFRGNKVNQATGEAQIAFFPNDPNLVAATAGLFMGGDTLDQWGVNIYNGGPDNSATATVNQFAGTDNPMGIFETIQWGNEVGQIEPGAFYNIKEILKLKDVNVVAYADSKDGWPGQTVQGIGNTLEDLANSVMVMGTKNELVEAMKIIGKIVPWALIAVAALIQPETIVTNLWQVLTWLAARIPFLAVGASTAEMAQSDSMLPQAA